MPATNLGIFKRWRQFTTASALAQLMFGTSHELVSRTGFYIGRVLDTSRYFSIDSACYLTEYGIRYGLNQCD